MKKLIFTVLLVLIGLLIIHFALSYRKYNVVLITIDTFRADYSSAYNPRGVQTPNIDRIASNGVLFKNSYCMIPLTLPSHAAMLTSLPPHELGLFNNGHIYDHRVPLLSEILASRGYATGAFLSMGVLKKGFGLHHGFQHYDDEMGTGKWYRVASEVNQSVLPWIEKNADNPFFAWIHYSDPHEPYITVDAEADAEVFINDEAKGRYCIAKKESHELEFIANPGENTIVFQNLKNYGNGDRITEFFHVGFRPRRNLEISFEEGWEKGKVRKKSESSYYVNRGTVRVVNTADAPQRVVMRFAGRGKVFASVHTVRENYIAEVQYLDRHIGELLDRMDSLGLLKKTIFVLTADHGEGFGEHGRVGHGYPLYNEVVRVPLIISYPKLGRQGKSYSHVVNALDITPTLLDLLHMKGSANMKGQSLRSLVSRSPVDWLLARKPDQRRIFLATYQPQGRYNSFATVEQNWKVMQTHDPSGWKLEAYDLKKDPVEKQNLYDADPSQVQSPPYSALRAVLQEHSKEAEELHKGHRKPVLTEEQKEMLRDLGYIN